MAGWVKGLMTEVVKDVGYDVVMNAVSIDMPKCKFCQSTNVVKNGKRNGTQYYLCRNCGRGFVYNKGLPRMRYPVDIVADGVYEYYAGESLNKITEGIRQKGTIRLTWMIIFTRFYYRGNCSIVAVNYE